MRRQLLGFNPTRYAAWYLKVVAHSGGIRTGDVAAPLAPTSYTYGSGTKPTSS